VETSSTSNDPVPKEYRIYMLRLWRAEEPDLSWRASLEDQRGGERIGFGSLEQLFAFLMEQIEKDAPRASKVDESTGVGAVGLDSVSTDPEDI
jgi:hypothetical protein